MLWHFLDNLLALPHFELKLDLAHMHQIVSYISMQLVIQILSFSRPLQNSELFLQICPNRFKIDKDASHLNYIVSKVDNSIEHD